MIGYIRGTVLEREAKQTIILTPSGVGYALSISANSAAHLPTNKDDEISLFVETIVREDAFMLFGFHTKEEQQLFRLLNNVNKVGPKLSLAILGADTPDGIVTAIRRNDSSFFKNVSGVGKKTAEKIIIDLRDKVENFTLSSGEQVEIVSISSATKEAEQGLITLGYSPQQIRTALKKIPNHEKLTSEQILREVLNMMRR
ncbi:Holliday junction branch migration protein RuvA [bacterium]|nr:Holliday junction branch migration protein RuvA [bacterium]